MSNNLNGVRIADNQTSAHHRTANEALNRIDGAITDGYAVGIPNTNTYAVANVELQAAFHFVIGNGATSASANFTIELPASIERGVTFWRNTLSYAATIRKVTSQTAPSVVIPPGGHALIEYDGSNARLVSYCEPFFMVIPVGDETTTITTGTAKAIFRMPARVWLTEVRASLSTAQTGGSLFTINVKEGGTTIFSTKPTIDNNEKTTTTAATAPVLSDTSIADDAEIQIDVDTVGTGTPKGLKVTFIGIRY